MGPHRRPRGAVRPRHRRDPRPQSPAAAASPVCAVLRPEPREAPTRALPRAPAAGPPWRPSGQRVQRRRRDAGRTAWVPGPGRPHPARRRHRRAADVRTPRPPRGVLPSWATRAGSPTTRVFDVLLDAVAGMPEARLTVAGDGPAAGALRRRATRPDLAGRVTFLGRLDDHELAAFYGGLDVSRGAFPDDADVGRAVRTGRGRGHGRRRPGRGERQWRTARRRRRGGAAGPARERRDPASGPGGRPRRPRARRAATRPGTASGGRLRLGSGGRPAPRDVPACDAYRDADRTAAARPSSWWRTAPRSCCGGRSNRFLRPLVVATARCSSWTTPPPRRCATSVARPGPSTSTPGATEASASGSTSPSRTSTTRTTCCSSTRTRWSAVTTSPASPPRSTPTRTWPVSRRLRPTKRGAPSAWPGPSPRRGAPGSRPVGLGRLGARHQAYVIGTVLLLRAAALRQVGGFDERFFLYAEETDWARRAARLGWRHAVVPTVTAVHVGAGTSPDATRRETHFHASQELYLRKHHGSWGWHVARSAQIAGSALRAVVLPPARRSAARLRLGLYLRGPARAETSLRPSAAAVGSAS